MGQKNNYASFLLFLGATLTFLFLSSSTVYADTDIAVIEGHNTCVQCHGRFPVNSEDSTAAAKNDRPAVIPKDKIDVLCMICHGPSGIATTKANIHGIENYVASPIGCITCHDPHSNNPNYVNGQNIKLIGRNLESTEGNGGNNYANIQTPNSGLRDVVFESRGTDNGESPLYSFADGDQDRDGYFSGVCEVCHTQTKFHRNNPSGDQSHYTGQTCTNCHVHVNQFLAFTEGPDGTLELAGSVVDASGSAWTHITIFLDSNGNGIYDEGEPTTTTDQYGNYTFEGLTNKGYAVLPMKGYVPEGYDVTASTYDNVVTIKTKAKLASVKGFVWNDTNLNAVYDASDPGIPNVSVFIDTNGNKTYDLDEPAAVTDSNGFYSLSGLKTKSKILFLIHCDESTAPEAYQLIGYHNPIKAVLDPGQILTDVNFGFRDPFQINPAKSRLLYPTRVTWKQGGGYFVTDSKVDAMFIYDSAGNLTGQLKGLNKPLGVITDAQGRIFIGNNERNNVEVYTAAGELQQVLGDGYLKMPNDLAFDREQRLYVLDSHNKHIRVFNQEGKSVLVIGRSGSGDGQFSFPIAIAINYRTVNDVEVGELFVADKQSSFIQVFDLEGNYLRSFGGPISETSSPPVHGDFYCWLYPDSPGCESTTTWEWQGKFIGIQSLAFDQFDRLHALDSYQDNVQILDPVTGAYINHYNAFLEDTGAHLQLDIDINSDGQVIMSNVTSRSVEFIYTAQ